MNFYVMLCSKILFLIACSVNMGSLRDSNVRWIVSRISQLSAMLNEELFLRVAQALPFEICSSSINCLPGECEESYSLSSFGLVCSLFHAAFHSLEVKFFSKGKQLPTLRCYTPRWAKSYPPSILGGSWVNFRTSLQVYHNLKHTTF